MFNIPSLLLGSPANGAQTSPNSSMVQIAMIAAVFLIFWLLIIRPQQKKQKKTKEMLSKIAKGDYVTSIGGICGTVKKVTEKSCIVEVDNKGNTLEFIKSAIGSVGRDSSPQPADSKSEDSGKGKEDSGKGKKKAVEESESSSGD